MKVLAGVWVASLPSEVEGRKVLGVDFISSKSVEMSDWKSSFSFSYYLPNDAFIMVTPSTSQIVGFHLARMEVDVKDLHVSNLMDVARKFVYPHIRKACLIADVSCRVGHVYVCPEVIFKLPNGGTSTWLGESLGSAEEFREDLFRLMEEVFHTCTDNQFVERINEALRKWAEAKEEHQKELRIAKLWTALDALLRERGEPVFETIRRRCLALTKKKTRESIDLLSIAGWRIAMDETEYNTKLKRFLKDTYKIRNSVCHSGKTPEPKPGFALYFSSLIQVLILKMAEIAHEGYTWKEAIEEIDKISKNET